jgi:hypothetical protein
MVLKHQHGWSRTMQTIITTFIVLAITLSIGALPTFAQEVSSYLASPTIANLDNSGDPEIIMCNFGSSQVEVYDAEGTMMPGWPRSTGRLKAPAAAADLNNDGSMEILVGDDTGTLHVWERNGEYLSGWPVTIDDQYRILAKPAVGDVDQDNQPEIVVPMTNGILYVLQTDGSQNGEPLSIGEDAEKPDSQSQVINSSPQIADLDRDGNSEIVVGSYDSIVYVFNLQGSYEGHTYDERNQVGDHYIAPMWIYKTGDTIMSTPAVENIDPNVAGHEVAIGSGDGYFYLLDNQGNMLWQYDTTFSIRSSPAVTDLDGNGDLEIIFGSDDDNVYALQHDGTDVSGWPQQTQADVFASPTVGDIDGDGSNEVIIGSDDANIYAWNEDGTLVSGWPKETERSVKATPALINNDDDSAMEVVIGDASGDFSIVEGSGGNGGNGGNGGGVIGDHVLFLPLVQR